jgi:hypothetical protein
MQNSSNDDKRYQRGESDHSQPKVDHDDHVDDVQHPGGDTDGVTPVRQTERREDRGDDDGMRPADLQDDAGL